MKLTRCNISVFTDVLNPTLKIVADMEFIREIEVPISVSGTLFSSDGKVLAFLHETALSHDSEYGLSHLSREDRQKLRRENNVFWHSVQLNALLTKNAVEYIERLREKNPINAVEFRLELDIKYLSSTTVIELINQPNLIKVHIRKMYHTITINQDDWIRNFARELGIGNFLLIELNIPDYLKVSEFWKQLYVQMKTNLEEMEISLRAGDWQKAMLSGRRFFENMKFGDKKAGNREFRMEFEKLMQEDYHSQDGIDHLYNAIWKLHEFISKYFHDRDKEGNLRPIPRVAKEDAYFVHATALGLFNLLGRKIGED